MATEHLFKNGKKRRPSVDGRGMRCGLIPWEWSTVPPHLLEHHQALVVCLHVVH